MQIGILDRDVIRQRSSVGNSRIARARLLLREYLDDEFREYLDDDVIYHLSDLRTNWMSSFEHVLVHRGSSHIGISFTGHRRRQRH